VGLEQACDTACITFLTFELDVSNGAETMPCTGEKSIEITDS